MYERVEKPRENKSKAVAQKQSAGVSIFQFVDNRPQAKQAAQLQSMADNSSSQQLQPIQNKENNTGLPDNLKTGMENLSGQSMDDVKVHYNSEKPSQLQAHAYAQGTKIYLGTGQEKHLPHEAWHVVQQKQGRVSPTVQLKGNVNINDDTGLEKEADVMGDKAMTHQATEVALTTSKISNNTVQREVITTRIKGVTHLVHAVHGSIYNGTPGMTLVSGTPIQVDTSDKIRSRRGPNQEHFRDYDAKNEPEYRWVRVISVDGKPKPEGTYVRDDTFLEGAGIPRGSTPFAPAIDHRRRKKAAVPERTFPPTDAPQWYERPFGHPKSSTADRKHAKLLAVAFGTNPAEIGPTMRASVDHEDTLMALETIGSHMTHVAPWIPTDVERHGKDRHEDYEKSGDYFRTSESHPVHSDYEMHQQALGIHEADVTTGPVNPGWANIAEGVMGVPNMRDREVEGPGGIRVRQAQNPDRIAKGPGAVIGHEEMARETAKMRHVLLQSLGSPQHELGSTDFTVIVGRIDREIQRLQTEEGVLNAEKANLNTRIKGYPALKRSLGPQLGKAKGEKNNKLVTQIKEEMNRNTLNEKIDKDRLRIVNVALVPYSAWISKLVHDRVVPEAKSKLQKKYRGSVVPGTGPAPLQEPKKTDLSPLDRLSPAAPVAPEHSFASRMFETRRNVKLPHLFGAHTVGGVTDVSGDHHPNIVLEKDTWKAKDGTQTGLKELQDGWATSGLHTSLQERGSFGHHRPSVSPLDQGRVRINPGLYPMSLLRIGIGAAVGVRADEAISPEEDFAHRDALKVAVQHAMHVIAVDRPGRSEKIDRIKTFAKHRLMINLLKAQTVLKAPIPNPREDRGHYIAWLQKDFSKASLALENLNESTHLLLSARINEESKKPGYDQRDEPLLLRAGPFQSFVTHEFGGEDRGVEIYYVASGMQAITTGAIAAVAYRREQRGDATSRPAGYVRLHPYFEMRGQAAAAAGFVDGSPAETIISDLSPVDTTATAAEQSKDAIRAGIDGAVRGDHSLVPVLDATAFPMAEVNGMVPRGTKNFIVVESLTKYAQLGSDKALGGRIIVVGSREFLESTSHIIGPVQQNAGMVISRIWFQSMEDMRYSH